MQAPREYTDRYVETYSVGWERIRKNRWQRAQELGLVAPGAAMSTPVASLSRWNWDTLSPAEQAFASRSMAVNAAMLEAMDFELGRLIDHLRNNGEYENTIFVVTSDNGPEAGDPVNTSLQSWLKWQGYHWDLETLGERDSYVAIGPEWAQAASGPTNLFKFHAGDGGLRVPLIMAGPGIPEATRVGAFTVMPDVAPTVRDLVQLSSIFPGAIDMSGRSLAPILSGDAQGVYAEDEAIGFETSGQAALFRGDVKLVRSMPPYGDGVWRLHNIVDDPGETTDLSETIPALKAELLHEYRLYANRHGVLELPAGYDPQSAIGANIARRFIGFYWSQILAAFALFSVLGWGLYRAVYKLRAAKRASGTVHVNAVN